jgi:K+-transporting ATPase ATPase C chain
MNDLRLALRPALVLLLFFTLLTGVLYPLVVTTVAQVFFPGPANGSLVLNGKGLPIGSTLIGQPFDNPGYFWGRPSATGTFPYNAAASSGSNDGPLNQRMLTTIKARIEALKAADPGNPLPLPVDLVTASGSGLDPQISPAAAEYQVRRVAQARGMSEAKVRQLVAQQTEGRTFGLLGEERVNVLLLNVALDK